MIEFAQIIRVQVKLLAFVTVIDIALVALLPPGISFSFIDIEHFAFLYTGNEMKRVI